MHYIVDKKQDFLRTTFTVGKCGIAVVSNQILSAKLERIYVEENDSNQMRGSGMGTILLNCVVVLADTWARRLTGKFDPFPGQYEQMKQWYKKRGVEVDDKDRLAGEISIIRQKCAELIDDYDLSYEFMTL